MSARATPSGKTCTKNCTFSNGYARSIDEGMQESGGGWVLLDYGDVILHLFTEELWEFYKLEELWKKAIVVMKNSLTGEQGLGIGDW